MYKKLIAALFIMLPTFVCCGCWSLVEVNQTALVAALGADVLDDDQMLFTVQLESASPPQEGQSVQSKNEVLTSTGSTMTEAARNINLMLPRIPLWSHASSLILGENLARQDLALIADFFARNRNVRMDSAMLVAQNLSPDQLLALNDPLSGCSGRCLDNLLQFQEIISGNYTPVTLADFLFKLSTPGVDPTLPILTTAPPDSGESMIISGMALFKGQRMVGVLGEKESRGYRWLNPGKNMGGLLVTQIPGTKDWVSFETVRFSSKQTPRLQNGELGMDIDLRVQLNFYEQQGASNLVGLYQRQELEIAAAQEIEREIRACITRCQSAGSDIMGWGQNIRRHFPAEWEALKNDWDKLYPQVVPHIKISCQLDRTYLSTKSFEFH